MRLTYETGVATMFQFIILAFLNIANTIYSIIVTCTHGNGQCVPNMLSSIVFYMLIVIWFGFIVVLGYGAQAKRSKKIARFLMMAEAGVFIVAAYNIKLGITYHNGALSLFTSLLDLVMSVWIISLAYRLMRAGGGRVVANHRRVRRHTDIN